MASAVNTGYGRPTQTRPHLNRRDQSPWWVPLLRGGSRPLVLVGDLIACLAAGFLIRSPWFDMLIFPVAFVAAQLINGMYHSRLVLSVLDDLPALARSWMFAVACVLIYHHVIFLWLGGVRMMLLAVVFVVALRAITYGTVRWFRTSGNVRHVTLIIGADAQARRLAGLLRATPGLGLHPIGFIDVDGSHGNDRANPPGSLPVLAAPPDLNWALDRYNPHALIVSRAAVSEVELVALLRECHRHSCEVFIIPRLAEVHHQSVDCEVVWDIPLIRLRRAAYRSGTWRLKRLFDIVVAAVALVLLSPVLIVCAIAVRLADGPGSVIFRQERVGVDGRRFDLLKFRSLKPVDNDESATNWNISHDDRLGPVGRFLRKTSLDELPQLVNIVRGEMSIVGPRPERPHFVEKFTGLYTDYYARHRVPCGLTGWAQIHGLRGDTPIADRARFDNWYIENWSLWLDLKIILRTVISVFKAPGS